MRRQGSAVPRFVPRLAGCVLLGLALAGTASAGVVDMFGESEPASAPTRDDGGVFELMTSNRLEEARVALDELLRARPDDAHLLELDGMLRVAEGDPRGAEQALERAYALSPETDALGSKLAAVKLANGKPAEAEAILARIDIEWDWLAQQTLARIKARRYDFEGAASHYRRAVRGRTDLTIVHFELAKLYEGMNRPAEIVALLGPLVSSDTRNVDVRAVYATALMDVGETKAAAEQMAAIRRIDPDNDSLPLLEALLARRDGDLARSEKLLRELVRAERDNHVAWYQLGVTLAASGDWKGALDAMERVPLDEPGAIRVQLHIAQIEINHGMAREAAERLKPLYASSSDPAAGMMLARARFASGETREALGITAKVVRESPELLQAYLLRGRMLIAARETEESIELGAELTGRFPEAASAWTVRAAALVAAGERPRAIDVLREGLAANPDSVPLKMELATNHMLEGELDRAEALYREVLAENPDDVVALNNLAIVRAQTPEGRREGLELAQRSYELSGGATSVQDTLGWLLHLNGEHAEALTLLTEASKAMPQDADVHCHLGAALASLGKREQAKSAVERCLSLGPTMFDSAEAQALLSAP